MSTRFRKDADLIKDLDPFHSMVPYIMAKRAESEVSVKKEFDVTNLVKYIEEYNKTEGNNLKIFHCITTAVAKTIYHRSKLNIFVSGRHFYQRKKIILSFVAKQKFADESVETLLTLDAKEDMNITDISNIILGNVKKVREEGTNDLDKTMHFIGRLPRFVLEILFFILSRLEYHGIYPQSLAYGDPNYSTVLLSNLGSIKTDSCYHHLSNFGTCSLMFTIGTLRKVDVVDENGKKTSKNVLDMTFTFDERIADGFYFANSIKYLAYLFEHPQLLEKPIKEQFPENAI